MPEVCIWLCQRDDEVDHPVTETPSNIDGLPTTRVLASLLVEIAMMVQVVFLFPAKKGFHCALAGRIWVGLRKVVLILPFYKGY